MDRSMDITPQESREVVSAPIQALAQGSMFWRPAYVASSAWLHHVPWLFWLVEALQPERCVTLGAAQGSPHLAFCQGMARLELSGDCLLVEPPGKEVAEDVHGWAERLYGSMASWLQTGFRKAAKQVENGSIDILALDVQEDDPEELEELIDRWLPRLSSKGVVLLPAINKRAGAQGIQRLFSELEREYPSIAFRHGEGLGVLLVGESIPPLLQTLRERFETPEAATLVRDVFARLGRGCADQAVIIDQKSRLNFFRQQLEEQEQNRQDVEEVKVLQRISEQRFNDAQAQLEHLRLEKQQLASESSAGGAQLSAVTQQLHEAQSLLQAREHQLAELQQTIALKDQELEAHLQELAEFSESTEQQHHRDREVASEVENSTSLLMKEFESAQEQWDEERRLFEASLDEYEQHVSQRDGEIAHLKAVIESKDQLLEELRSLGQERSKDSESRRAEYSSLLKSIEQYRHQLDESHATLQSIQLERERLKHENDSLTQQVQLQQASFEQLNVIESKNADLQQQLEYQKQLTRDYDAVQLEVGRLQQELKERDSTISRQFEELQTQQKQQQKQQRASSEQLRVIEGKNADLQQQLEHQQRLTRDYDAVQLEVERLKSELRESEEIITSQFEALSSMSNAHEPPEAENESDMVPSRATSDIGTDMMPQYREQQSSDDYQQRAVSSVPVSHKVDPESKSRFSGFGSLGQGLDRRKKRKLERQAQEQAYKDLVNSEWFDAAWYLRQYSDVAEDEWYSKHPGVHYLKFGGFEARNPSPYFDSEAYLYAYPDVAETGVNPLLHFIRQGQKEGRSPQPK